MSQRDNVRRCGLIKTLIQFKLLDPKGQWLDIFLWTRINHTTNTLNILNTEEGAE